MSKRLRFFAVILAVLILASGCNLGNEKAEKPDPQMGKLDFEAIDTDSDTFKKLYEEEDFQNWYQRNFRQKGAYSFETETDRYILLSAGEKNTGGYFLDNIVLTGKEEIIEARARLNVPSDEAGVVHQVTYPLVLLRIPKDDRELAFSGFEEVEYKVEKEVLKGTGTYIGQIDSSSVEIEVNGEPTAFQLDAPLKEDFEERFGLQSEDEVSFSYIVDEYQRNVIKDIKKL